MPNNPFVLDNKLVLITGGGAGIGKAIAVEVANAGGRVVITGRRGDVLAAACAEIGDRAEYVVNDVADLPGIPSLIGRIEKEIGPLYGLVNNAGVTLMKAALETTDEDFLRLLTVHLRASFSLIRESAGRMAERKSGSIVNICSLSAIFGVEHCVAYTAAKSGMKSIVRPLAMELAPLGVRINDIAPGWIESDMTRASGNPARKKRIEERTPMGRYGNPEEIAFGAVYLLSPAAGFVTGTELVIDGGMTAAGMYVAGK
ncbi:MAG: SDR family oxidoreductase [Planctomycetota bacterium]|jgi:NAD(P)-dependent dehydrogenase (short-subunit alcohol dehydrogenase family)|nr:SDR family oxidoreductase [Planctomycetota bacterium]